MLYLVPVATFVLGGLVGYFIAGFIKNARKDAEIVAEQKISTAIQKTEEELSDRFKSVANEVLRQHSRDFLEQFKSAREVINTDLEHKETGFKNIADNIDKSVKSVNEKVASWETQRNEQFGALGESIKRVLDTGTKIEQSTLSLKAVLSSASPVRGRWGETVLKNILTECGLQEGTDFLVQQTLSGEESSLRPDIIINLPGGLKLAVDSKASLEDFMRAVETTDEAEKERHLGLFSTSLKNRVKALSTKEYQRYLDNRIPYVIMFIPGEAAVRAVFEKDPSLYREAQNKSVMLASPATIMPLILLIAHAWKQHKAAENAVEIMKQVGTLGIRLKTFAEHFVGIGSNLSSATKKYNSAVGSLDSMVLPQVERLKELGASVESISQLQPIEVEPRESNKVSPVSPQIPSVSQTQGTDKLPVGGSGSL
nr:hypothetical protein [uncultured bacterium]